MPAKLLMPQDEIDRDPERWKAIRRGGITASEIAAVLGIAPGGHNSAFKLFTAKITGEDFDHDAAALRRGRFLEPLVAEEFEVRYPYLHILEGGLYASEERPWQMATFDRLAIDPSVLGIPDTLLDTAIADRDWIMAASMPVQIKTARSPKSDNPALRWGDPGSRSIPRHYLAQAIWEMDVRGAHTVFVPVLFWETWTVEVYIIERDADVEQDIEVMREMGEEFMLRINRDDPPPVDWTPATTEALKILHPGNDAGAVYVPMGMARKYQKARAARQRAERRVATLENQIRDRMGSGRWAYAVDADGAEHKVLTRSIHDRDTIDSGMLRERYPNIAKEVTRTSKVDALYPSGWSTRGDED